MKLRFNFLLVIIIALTSTFTSCKKEDSDSVDQDKIWVFYRLVYDANSDITYARATFRFSSGTGTKLELVDPATIRFNGDNLVFQEAIAYYEKQYSGLVSSGTFVYEDLDGNTFSNSVTMPSSIGFPAGLDSISTSSSYEMFWTGNALSSTERVDVTMTGDNTTGTLQIFSTTGNGATSIIFGMNKLQNLGTGVTTMYMDKVKTSTSPDGTSAGALVESRYKAVNNPNVQVTN